MKNIIKTIPVLLLVVATSCSKLDINVNPVNPVTAPTSLRLPAILGNMAYHNYSHARFSAYHAFYITNRLNTSKIEALWNYNDVTRLGAWRWHYFDVGSNCKGMIETAQIEGSYNYMGVGKIMLAYSYLTATDSFGDMPFKEAYSGSFNPVYDTQQAVYEGIAQLLEDGLADLAKAGPSDKRMDATSDLIFQGDVSKWAAFAKAVKARMYLHTANFDNGYDRTLNTVNDALNTFSDAIFYYPKGATREWEMNLWGPKVASPEWNFADIRNSLVESMHTDFLMNYLTVNENGLVHDPRLYKLTTPGANNKYLSARASEGTSTAGLPTGTTMADFANLYNGFWTANDSPLPFILKEELYFIKAEVAFKKEDKPTAHEAYKAGIEANLRRLGVSEQDITAYMGSSKVISSAGNLKISDIMMQKYVALYLQPETWVDMRRYGYSATAYPGIYYPKNALAEWQGKWIQRLPYDKQTEYIYNPREIERLGAGARSWTFTPVWWAEQSQLKN
ncbi:SusD/RagB family nutrient-binding outer membrane lipoprotein [Pedobacter frigoris]|uniref:SusD/RagB family nutrient-binding outer membrane lipoprotein n=1 Tax=Pedobacter frigoris TaxID=2571272 RepID=A0A4U1CF13_9SPHI|nr:SusD/RagB family nutrient-binding outer membrane lipoprotein [Pedobacter frigoris]TKC05120.1 SusD/RagB family nutrient-binding outer membrane lipoprotein [Pedobacter frigoris]